jgi:hypothetical protein
MGLQAKESLILRTDFIMTCCIEGILSVFFPGHLKDNYVYSI